MKISLRSKTIILILLITLTLSGVGIYISGSYVHNIIDNSYQSKAREISDTVSVVVDSEDVETLYNDIMAIYEVTEDRVLSDDWGSDEFNAYIAKFSEIESTDAYISLMKQLRAIQEVNDVDCLYISALTPDTNFIYLIDAALEDACPPGTIDPLYEENDYLLENPEAGFTPYFTDTGAYGYLVTSGAPIYNKDHKVIAYAMVDISMDVVNARQIKFITELTLLLIAFTLIICLISIIAVNRYVINPINKLSAAASRYSNGKDLDIYKEFDSIKIKTNDEIETLHDSIKKMLSDIHEYIENLMKTTKELNETKIIAEEMNELAHVDLLTGLKSRTAYVSREVEINKMLHDGNIDKFAVILIDLNYLKQINDEFGHEKGDIALINTGALIQNVFGNEDSYRIGGDEFVVVDTDVDNLESKINKFNELMKNDNHTNRWEHISAALGFGLYEKGTDLSVNDVLSKADTMMYINKKAMKADIR